MKTGVNHIDWAALNRLVDPQYNQTATGTVSQTAGISLYDENSMANLTETQQTFKDSLMSRYADDQDQKSSAECYESLKQYIIEMYTQEPAIHDGKVLPLEYNFDYESQAKKEAYFTNSWHTAYRYLFGRGRLPNISENDLALIRSMWMAFNDPFFDKLSVSFTHDAAKKEFINTIASLARAHNWDRTRPVIDKNGNRTGREEFYDDLQEDKPSCIWGVTQRLVQFVTLAFDPDPNERSLAPEDIVALFREKQVAPSEGRTVLNAVASMDLEMLQKFEEDYLELLMCTDEEEKAGLSSQIIEKIQPYTTGDIERFISDCKDRWGSYRLTQKLNEKVRYKNCEFDNYGLLALYIAQNSHEIYSDDIGSAARVRLKPVEDARQAAEQERVRRELEEKAEKDQLRAQILELAFANKNTENLEKTLDYTLPELLQALQLQQAEAARQAELQRQQAEAARQAAQPQTSALLHAYQTQRQGASAASMLSNNLSVKPEIAQYFKTEIAKRLLERVEQNASIVALLNTFSEVAAQKLAAATQAILDKFSVMNIETQKAFLTAFSQKYAATNKIRVGL